MGELYCVECPFVGGGNSSDSRQGSPCCFKRSTTSLALRANAAEWMARRAGRWSFECRIHSPYDLPGTAERWRRCSVASPPPGAADTTAHFELARHSHSIFQR